MISRLSQGGFLGFVMVFMIVAVLAISGIFIVINLPNSLPGDMTYPIKGIYENLQLAANELSFEGRAKVFIDLSNNRLGEFEKLVERREYSRISETLEGMVLMQKKALDNIEQVQNRSSDISASLSKLTASFEKQQNTLRKLYFEIPPENYIVLDKAIEYTQYNLTRAELMKSPN